MFKILFLLLVGLIVSQEQDHPKIPQKDKLSIDLNRIDEYMQFVNYIDNMELTEEEGKSKIRDEQLLFEFNHANHSQKNFIDFWMNCSTIK